MKQLTYRARAPFLVNNRWQWHTWQGLGDGNKHAFLIAKRDELKATGVDFGQADYEELSRAGF